MGAVATFDWPTFSARYPTLAGIGEPAAAALFVEAAIYHDNTGAGPVADAGQQRMFLNMVTAHLAVLNFGENGAGPSPLVGRISNASEGSVSVATDFVSEPGSAAWWNQTRFGAQYWAASRGYRTFRYMPGPRTNMVPWGRGVR